MDVPFLVEGRQNACLLPLILANGQDEMLGITMIDRCEPLHEIPVDHLYALLHGTLETPGMDVICVIGQTRAAMLHRHQWNLVECPRTRLSLMIILLIAAIYRHPIRARAQIEVIMDHLPDRHQQRHQAQPRMGQP